MTTETTTDGTIYVPYEERTGAESKVYFTRDLSPAGLSKIYARIASALTGKTAVKLHTGEKHGPNIIPASWVKDFLATSLPDGRIGKKWIHTREGSDFQWSIDKEEIMERITESAKSVVDHFAPHIAFINVMRNMSVSCDCEGVNAMPVVTPNVGIVASLDMLAVDQASVDLVYAMKEDDRKALVERIESRHGLRQLGHMKEMGVGNNKYELIDIDNGDAVISVATAVKDVVPFQG